MDGTEQNPSGSLLRRSETAILFFGLLLLAFYLVMLLTSWIFFPEDYKVITGVTFSNVLAGRAAGLSVGFAGGMTFVATVLINLLVEFIMVLITYPLFILSWNNLLHIRGLGRWLDATHRAAERYHDKIGKYGMIGLFLFVWFPFWMTGPVVGAVIGFLMGLRHRVTLFIVMTGTFIATVCWAALMKALHRWAASIDERGPWLIVIAVILLVLIGMLLQKLRRH